MSVASDDVHDLFGRDEDDSGDDERSGESAEWATEVDFPSFEEDDSPADPTSEETADSRAGPSDRSDDGGFGEFETPDSTTASATNASDRFPDDAAGAFEPAGSTSPSEGSDGDDTDDSGMTWSPTSTEEASGDHGDAFERTETSTSTVGPVDDRAGESVGPDPAATPEGAAGDEGSESQPAVSSTDPADADEEAVDSHAVEEDIDGAESAESSAGSSEGGNGDDTGDSGPAGETESVDESGSARSATSAASPEESVAAGREGSAKGGATASTGEVDADDRKTSTFNGTATSVDEPALGDEADSETAGGSELGSTATTASPVGPTVTVRDDTEATSSDGPGSVAAETGEDERVAATASGSNRLPTGIDELDRAMGGGVPPGRLVVLVADPGVQSELIVDSVLAQRDTLFVTTDRPDWEVVKDIEPGLGSGEVMIRDHTPDSLLSGIDSLLEELGTSSNFVLDSVNELELVPRQRYRIFLSDVKRRLFDTGSIGLLTGVTVGHESARDLTLRRADIVWRLETRTTDHEIENRLSVPKFRGGAAMTETVRLELTDEVRVDTG